MVRHSVLISMMFLGLLSGFMVAATSAQDSQTDPEVSQIDAEDPQSGSKDNAPRGTLSDDPHDPGEFLSAVQERGAQKESVFRMSPLAGLHETTDKAKEELYDATNLKLGLSLTHLSQWLSESLPGEDTSGSATELDFVTAWELYDQGEPTQGQVFFHLQGRWDYGTTGPEDLAAGSLGSLNGTANSFSAYSPAFLMRNLYWQQGSQEAGWTYRIGKITPDAILATSAHISAQTAFLSTTGIGSFVNGYADSGLGVVGAWYINDRIKLLGLFSDANGDRYDFGDINEGDYYKALELGVKIDPRTPKAGYSKVTLWHTDGTQDGLPSNGQLGPDGWGYFLKHEQELTDDGRAIGILKYGQSFEDAAFYEQQAGGYFLLYDPTGLGHLKNDLFGVGYSWAQATETTARDESGLEVFYRFPIYPLVDMTLAYQSVFNPALDPDNDQASVFSIRLRTTF